MNAYITETRQISLLTILGNMSSTAYTVKSVAQKEALGTIPDFDPLQQCWPFVKLFKKFDDLKLVSHMAAT